MPYNKIAQEVEIQGDDSRQTKNYLLSMRSWSEREYNAFILQISERIRKKNEALFGDKSNLEEITYRLAKGEPLRLEGEELPFLLLTLHRFGEEYGQRDEKRNFVDTKLKMREIGTVSRAAAGQNLGFLGEAIKEGITGRTLVESFIKRNTEFLQTGQNPSLRPYEEQMIATGLGLLSMNDARIAKRSHGVAQFQRRAFMAAVPALVYFVANQISKFADGFDELTKMPSRPFKPDPKDADKNRKLAFQSGAKANETAAAVGLQTTADGGIEPSNAFLSNLAKLLVVPIATGGLWWQYSRRSRALVDKALDEFSKVVRPEFTEIGEKAQTLAFLALKQKPEGKGR